MSNTYVRVADVANGNILHGLWIPTELVRNFQPGDVLNLSSDRFEIVRREFEVDVRAALARDNLEIDVKLHVKEA